MKKIIYSLSCCMIAGAFIACGGGAKNAEKKGLILIQQKQLKQ